MALGDKLIRSLGERLHAKLIERSKLYRIEAEKLRANGPLAKDGLLVLEAIAQALEEMATAVKQVSVES